jgi:enoyl reductase
VAITVGVLSTVGAPTALAGTGWDDSQGGGKKGDQISATVSVIRYDESKNGSGKATGAVTAAGNWTPPACWYEPKWTPEQFKAYVEPIWAAESTGYEWDAKQRDRYVNGHPYKDFNLSKSGDGYWWYSAYDPARITDPHIFDCNEPYFWVDKGKPSPIKNSVTPEILAQLAYAKVRVPATQINLSPESKQTVNLATWAWLDKAIFKPVSVTASVDLLGISATTTATPVALHLDPGTSDADVYPASGDCTINKDGSIGTPYANGDENKTPPCGLTYRRSSTANGGTFPLKATITWKVSWTGSGGSGGNLPDGTFGNTTNVTVQEVQTVNR